ncbi:MAG: hypothetical protein PHT07_20930 [Paludibacter sp.]|nr:hypothetical protein [Paludibacter sp.]
MQLAKKEWVNDLLSAATVYIGSALKNGYVRLTGHVKVDNRPSGGTTDDYALQVRSESAKTSGTHWGVDCETHLKKTGSASIRSVQGVAVVDSTFTATGATLNGVYGQVRNDGAIAGASFLAALYGVLEAGQAITASHVCAAWLDSHQANAVTGEHELLYMSNNGAASLDQVIYASGQAETLLHVNAAGGPALNYVSDGAAVGAVKKIKIKINGVEYYINCNLIS